MSLGPGLRWALAISVASAAGVAVWGGDDATDVAVATTSASASRVAGAARTPAQAGAPSPRAIDAALLGTRRDDSPWPDVPSRALAAWGGAVVPPVPARRTTPPPAPVDTTPKAPPFTYELIGRFDDGHGPQALLSGPTRTLAVRSQDVIDGQWRVDDVQPGGVTLTWLPGSTHLTLGYRTS